MFRRVFLTAIVAGLLAGLVISVVQEFTTTPIILQAETFENAGPATGDAASAPHAHSHGSADANDGHSHGDEEAWAPEEGFERVLFTSLSNLIFGVAFALLLVGAFSIAGRQVDGKTGVMWGLAGFAAFSLAPALGLPPEVPGSVAADVLPRQGWWFIAAFATAGGLALLVFGAGVLWRIAGVILLVLPHVIGAPHPPEGQGTVPPELAAHFVSASLVTAAVFWALLGWLSGTLWRRLGGTAS